jgi:hypothetical protein
LAARGYYKFIFLRIARNHLPAILYLLAGLGFSRLSVIAFGAMAPLRLRKAGAT